MTTTGSAADIIGIRYETLRNWLKIGLLSGNRNDNPGRRKWRSYSPGDLARIRLVKDALDAALALDVAIDVSNDAEVIAHLDNLTAEPVAAGPYVMIWPGLPEAQFMIAASHQIAQEIRRNPAPVVIFDLSHTVSRVRQPNAS